MNPLHIWLLLPLWLFLLIAPWTPEWDLTIANSFFQQGHFQESRLYTLIFDYGPWPGLALGAISACLALIAYLHRSYQHWLRPALFLLAVLVIFEGAIIHGLKDTWGRPRPKQVIEFGGKQAFRPYYQPNFFNRSEPAKSFPCGHCGMGFYFFALALLGWRMNSNIALYLGLSLGLLLGMGLAWIRMAQGGHFLSDVIASLLIMGYGIYWCDILILRGSYSSSSRISSVSGSNASSL